MPNEHVQLAQAPNGEIGPRCHTCGIRLTFGNAMVHNQITTVGPTRRNNRRRHVTVVGQTEQKST